MEITVYILSPPSPSFDDRAETPRSRDYGRQVASVCRDISTTVESFSVSGAV